MTICDFCGEEVSLSYTCKECRGRFCIKHRRPEDHQCSSKESNEKKTIVSYEFQEILEESPFSVVEKEHQNIEEITQDHISETLVKEPEIIEEANENQIIKTESEWVERARAHKPKIIEEVVAEEFVSETPAKEDKKIRKIASYLPLMKVGLLVVSLVLNGYFFLDYRGYRVLNTEYLQLYSTSIELEQFYDNLTTQYNELRSEYSQLNKLYQEKVNYNSELERELDDILTFKKNIRLEPLKTITLLPKQNYSSTYKIPFSGYISVKYNASDEAYAWVGSTNIGNMYFSRNPQFPETASNYNFTVPVMPDLIIYFANPDEFESIEISYSINFTY